MRSLTRFATKVPAFLPLALFLALTPNALAHTTWYVDGVNGNDTNNCQTPATACKTIGHAISLASSGDAITVAQATYTENLTININLSIIGFGSGSTIVDGGGVGPVVTIYPPAKVILGNLTIRNGYNQSWGGGIVNWATLTIDQSAITANSANTGGGIWTGGTLTVKLSTISGNSAFYEYGYAGGIYNQGLLTVNQSTISANSAYDGGGVCSQNTLTINNSAISGNNSTWGGGIEIIGGTGTITNSTFSGNSATDAGGAIDNYGTLTINNSTLSANSAVSGGGFEQVSGYGGSVTFQNSIIANNSGGNCLGTVTSDGYNLSSDNSCSFNGPGDMNNTIPRLGSLGNYGGPTQTIIEMLASPTVDAGNPNGCTDSQGNLLTTDQRGAPRPGLHKSDKRCDMGAFERQTD